MGSEVEFIPKPRIVRLDALTPPQRRLVMALIEAKRAADAKKQEKAPNGI